jgi:hypothetical protein
VVKHGALSKSHVYQLLRSKDARVRRAAFMLLERSNPKLRTNSELFVEITRFIWDANPSYDVYQEFTKRHFQASYKVHELISARVKAEKQNKPSAVADNLTDNTRPYEGGLFKRLVRWRSSRSQSARCEARKCGATTWPHLRRETAVVLRRHRDHPRPDQAQTTARDARRMSLLSPLNFQKSSAVPASKISLKPRRCCFTFARVVARLWLRCLREVMPFRYEECIGAKKHLVTGVSAHTGPPQGSS